MKVIDSGMPDEKLWESFFNVDQIIDQLIINQPLQIIEIGCGYGTFTVPLAKNKKNNIITFDIESNLITDLKSRAETLSLNNLKAILRDIIKDGTGLSDENCDHFMLYNILHHERPEDLINEAKRNLKLNGHLSIIHWRSDIPTPRGPSLDIRPFPSSLIELSVNLGLDLIKEIILEPYHFGLLFKKTS